MGLPVNQYMREPLTVDEERLLRGGCRKPVEIATVVVLLETGLRVSEFCELEPDQVDWQGRRLIVHGKTDEPGQHNTKNRVVPISDECFGVLAHYRYLFDNLGMSFARIDKVRTGKTARVNPVFLHERQEPAALKIIMGRRARWISTRTVERIVLRCANRAGVTKPVSPHVLRHTFAVRCLQRGIHPRSLMLLLGHENFATTMKYLRLAPEDVVGEFMTKWDRDRYSWDMRRWDR
jgi:integrase/recombinase XerD